MKPSEIILTDTHLSKNTIEENISIFTQVIAKAKKLKLKRVLHLGDIFSNRESLSLNVLIAFSKILDLFKNANIELITIAGNHDKPNLNANESYLSVFKNHDFFTYIDKPFQTKSTCGNINLFFLPYYKEIDLYPELLKEISERVDIKNNILLTHIAVNGVMNNDGTVVSNAIPVGSFKAFDRVFIGHYHNRNEFENIHYIGSAFPQNFGEDANKGFTILYSDCEYEYFKPDFIEYVTLDVPAEQVDHFVATYHTDVKTDDKIRFILTGDQTVVNAVDRKRIQALGIKVETNPTEIEKNIEHAKYESLIKFNNENVIEHYKVFCKLKNYSSDFGVQKLKECYVADRED